jgi:hypothetical protein
VSDAEWFTYGKTVLQWLGGGEEPASVAQITKRLEAVLEFTVYVLREFLTREYKLENHDSDLYDQFQLHYLAMDQFVIVTEDKDFRTRVNRSAQATRILSFEEFLRGL